MHLLFFCSGSCILVLFILQFLFLRQLFHIWVCCTPHMRGLIWKRDQNIFIYTNYELKVVVYYFLFVSSLDGPCAGGRLTATVLQIFPVLQPGCSMRWRALPKLESRKGQIQLRKGDRKNIGQNSS